MTNSRRRTGWQSKSNPRSLSRRNNGSKRCPFDLAFPLPRPRVRIALVLPASLAQHLTPLAVQTMVIVGRIALPLGAWAEGGQLACYPPAQSARAQRAPAGAAAWSMSRRQVFARQRPPPCTLATVRPPTARCITRSSRWVSASYASSGPPLTTRSGSSKRLDVAD